MELSKDAIEIIQGLRQSQKRISSKFFYDDEGDKIFQEIMNMPEYYLTNAEKEIFTEKGKQIANTIKDLHTELNVIELGAGDGTKTMHLLEHLDAKEIKVKYFPVDISSDVLVTLENNIPASIQHIPTHPITSNFIDAIPLIGQIKGPKLVLFIGSTIGNFQIDFAQNLMSTLSKNLGKKDLLLLGTDIKKDPLRVRKAYDDPHGITRRFNFNLFKRFNREYGANFNEDDWYFYCNYNPLDGEVNSYLVSKKEQTVTFSELSTDFNFKAGEAVHTEISRKFDLENLEKIFEKSGFEIHSYLTDSNKDFQVTLLSNVDTK